MNSAIPIVRADGPVLIFGGPYSNLEATVAIFAAAAQRSIPPNRVICTGDVVAYGADAAGTAHLVREFGCHVVMGNCEESLAEGTQDCGCGFPEDSSCQRLSSAWFAHADRTVDADLRSWMRSLPRRIHLEFGGTRLAVIHGGIDSINEFVFASTPADLKAAQIGRAGVDGIVAGHCGIPFTQIIDGYLWHNAGAIGMPANDGTSAVWFSVLTSEDDSIAIEHVRLEYDHNSAARKMLNAGLPDGYAQALSTGLWPSLDVLPFMEIRATGLPLSPARLCWTPGLKQKLPRPRVPSSEQMWPDDGRTNAAPLSGLKFRDPERTATGQQRAKVMLEELRTLWINTGTLCNITCRNCYIESSPKNDRLAYISRSEVEMFLDEISKDGLATSEIGFTGGEPFMNPEIIAMLMTCLDRGFKVLVLTNAMLPMQRHKAALEDLRRRFPDLLSLRVSLDHFTAERHEEVRGPNTFSSAIAGLKWLSDRGFNTSIAGRTMWDEDQTSEREGYLRLTAQHNMAFAAQDPGTLVLFPEMEAGKDVPEITTACWDILHKSPSDVMCSSSRMVVKRKGAAAPAVVACTLLPYDEDFQLGETLKQASAPVALNHQYCAQFCVLGGSSCSAK